MARPKSVRLRGAGVSGARHRHATAAAAALAVAAVARWQQKCPHEPKRGGIRSYGQFSIVKPSCHVRDVFFCPLAHVLYMDSGAGSPSPLRVTQSRYAVYTCRAGAWLANAVRAC
eukprot:6178146-Pleurochrysis_carterae.AAC.3